MGTNAVRLVRSDHRRIGELLTRLNGRHRGGAGFLVRVGNELAAHVTACRDCLLPFAHSRVSIDGAVAASLDELMAAANVLRTGATATPSVSPAELGATMDRHADTEDRVVLQPLQNTVNVGRLRLLGESFRRVRDSALRAEGGRRHRTRPTASRAELYERARYLDIDGRSAMSKEELLAALKKQP